jgi:hypothetical protein
VVPFVQAATFNIMMAGSPQGPGAARAQEDVPRARVPPAKLPRDMSFSPTTPSRDDVRFWLASFGFSHFVSLAYNASLSAKQAVTTVVSAGGITIASPSRRVVTTRTITLTMIRAHLRELDGVIHARLFHRKWNQLPSRRRIFWIATVEGGDTNPHVHLLCRVPLPLALPFARLFGSTGREDIWRDMIGSGDSHVRLVDHDPCATGYAIKTRPDLAPEGRMILASEFWPSRASL